MSSGPTLEEISTEKQIRAQLKKCTYEQLYDFATCPPKEYPGAFNLLKIIHTILSPSAGGDEAAEEQIACKRRNLTINLAREVIEEKYPDRKQPTKLEDYL